MSPKEQLEAIYTLSLLSALIAKMLSVSIFHFLVS